MAAAVSPPKAPMYRTVQLVRHFPSDSSDALTMGMSIRAETAKSINCATGMLSSHRPPHSRWTRGGMAIKARAQAGVASVEIMKVVLSSAALLRLGSSLIL